MKSNKHYSDKLQKIWEELDCRSCSHFDRELEKDVFGIGPERLTVVILYEKGILTQDEAKDICLKYWGMD